MKILMLIVLILTAALASAETYKWEDRNGMHFTENLASVPKKYRARAIAEASGDITTKDPDVARSVENGTRRHAAIEAQERAVEQAEKRRQVKAQTALANYWAAEQERKALEETQAEQRRRDSLREYKMQSIENKINDIDSKLRGF